VAATTTVVAMLTERAGAPDKAAVGAAVGGEWGAFVEFDALGRRERDAALDR